MGKRNRAERHKGRRRRFTPERPLELSGAVDLAEPVPPRWARVGRALEAVVSALPTYRSGTREGRQKVLALRSVVAVAALMLVSLGRDQWYWGVSGVVVAVLLFVVPLADVRRRRLIDAARRLGRPGQRWVPSEAEVHFDGTKLSVRTGGRTWRSVRPHAVPQQVSVGRASGWLYIELTPKAGAAAGRNPFRFRVDAAAVPEHPDEVAVEGGPAVTVDAAGWALLIEQLAPQLMPRPAATASPPPGA